MRREFSAKVKIAAYEAAQGHCVRCTAKLYPGKFRYNHRIPCALGGEATLQNCELLCVNCDSVQTYGKDIPVIAKTKRIRTREAGVKRPRAMTRWRDFQGRIVTAPRER